MSQGAGGLTGFPSPLACGLAAPSARRRPPLRWKNPATGEVIAQVANADSAD